MLTKLLTTVVNILREDKKDRAQNDIIMFFNIVKVGQKRLWLNRSTTLKPSEKNWGDSRKYAPVKSMLFTDWRKYTTMKKNIEETGENMLH